MDRGQGALSIFCSINTADLQRQKKPGSWARLSWTEIAFAFSKAPRQIGDASEGSDHLRLVVGPAAERDCYRPRIGTGSRASVGGARRKNAGSEGCDPSVAPRCRPTAD